MCIDARLFFACGSSAPVSVEREGGTAAWVTGTLEAASVQGHTLSKEYYIWDQAFYTNCQLIWK